MFARIASFEFRYQLRQPAFWVIAIVFGLLAFGAVASPNVQIGSGGNVLKNAPFSLATAHIIFNVFFIPTPPPTFQCSKSATSASGASASLS